MSEDESLGHPVSTQGRFLLLMTPDIIHDSTHLSLEVIREESDDIRRTVRRLIDQMSIRLPQDREWQHACQHLEFLAARLAVLGSQEAAAIRNYTYLGMYRLH